MPFMLSPGVQVVEKDFSSIVPAVSSSTGAFAGPFAWGPVEDPIRISSENELVTRFGTPEDSNYASFFSAANFLSYTNSLFVARTDASALRNAVTTLSSSVTTTTLSNAGSGYVLADTPTVTFSAPQLPNGITATGTVTSTVSGGNRTITGITITNPGSGYTSAPTVTVSAPASGVTATVVATITLGGVKIKNVNDFLDDYQVDTGIHGEVVAKFPGTYANGLMFVLLDAGNWPLVIAGAADPTDKAKQGFYTSIKNAFTAAPSTSSFASSKGITNDEVHVLVFDTPDGRFSGTSGSLLEKYSFLSKLKDAKRSDGANIFWKSVINAQSKYVWALGVPPSTKLSIVPTSVVSSTALVFSASAKTITVVVTAETPAATSMAAFKTFFDAAIDKLSTQIQVSGATNSGNNKFMTVTSVTVTGGTTYVITVAESLVNETSATTASISGVVKSDWNVQSSTFNAVTSNKTLKVLSVINEITLSGGVSDMASTDANIQTAYSLFANTDEYDISLVVTGNVSPITAAYVVDNVAEVRKDCVVFISPNDDKQPITGFGSDATDKIITYRNALDVSSSYAVMDSGFKYQYDRYNDTYRWIPLNGDIAGLCARTDFTSDPWFSPGGYTRGQIKNIVKLAFNPSQTDRDVLYPAGVNPVVTFPGQGTILFGDKTLLSKPSAFDRINVRRLFIVLEKSIATAAKFQLFEFNDSFTRAQFRNLVEPFLRDVQGRRGVIDFRVKCDESNNSGEVIDRNEFVADIFIKPNRSINYITLNFVAARSSVSFEEIGA
jgi:phage tail sheath protein FI